MNGLLLLLYCIEILGAPLCGAQNISGYDTSDLGNSTVQGSDHSTTFPASQTTSLTGPTSAASDMFEASSLRSTQSPTTVSPLPNSHRPSPGPQPTIAPNGMFYWKECLPVLMVTGGLIIACTILLVSTLLLAWKVCQLSRHIKALSSNADLISTSEYWMGTAKKNKGKSETEAKETCVLMADLSETQEEMGNGTTKEEGGKVNEDGQMGEENKKEVGDTANTEEASTTPVTVAESSSSSKPQEEATDSQSTKAVAASPSEGTGEPKDVV